MVRGKLVDADADIPQTYEVVALRGYAHFRNECRKECKEGCKGVCTLVWCVDVLSYCYGITVKATLCYTTYKEASAVNVGCRYKR